jgi:soluble lytic murein transglycosylase-like protein
MLWAGVHVATSTHTADTSHLVTQAPSAPAFSDPGELSPGDVALYDAIFKAQADKDFDQADALIGQLGNTHLLGYVLAERYLARGYKPSDEELSLWLDNYADHPQAARISRLADHRGLDATDPENVKPLKGEGYTDHLGRSSMPDSWFTGLSQWRAGSYKSARKTFERVAKDTSLTPWQQAAAHYWAYRANLKQGDEHAATKHLNLAAEYPTTFYGLLAAEQLGERRLVVEAPEVSDALRRDPRAIRAALLVTLDRNDAAEEELRRLYNASSESDRPGIITLASELDMPNLQMRLAKTQGLSEAERIFAKYPAPYYMVKLHDVADPALLLAVARNESGFREVARSEAGATGMMQMLPSTARLVERNVGRERLQTASIGGSEAHITARLNQPELSARYGAEYLRMLATTPCISHNLVHLLVGYNAGPGTVISWKAAGRNIKDPLLYIESMPYAETRNYVMQVSAQYWIYQMMMDKQPATLATLAKGKWPMIERTGQPEA